MIKSLAGFEPMQANPTRLTQAKQVSSVLPAEPPQPALLNNIFFFRKYFCQCLLFLELFSKCQILIQEFSRNLLNCFILNQFFLDLFIQIQAGFKFKKTLLLGPFEHLSGKYLSIFPIFMNIFLKVSNSSLETSSEKLIAVCQIGSMSLLDWLQYFTSLMLYS